MTLHPSYIKVVMVCAMSALSFWGIWSAWRHLFSIRYYTCLIDPRFSVSACDDITKIIADHKNVLGKPSDVSEIIKQHFNAVKSVIIEYAGPFFARIQVHAQKPVLHINGTHILTEDSALVYSHSYDFCIVEGVPCMQVWGDIFHVVSLPCFFTWFSGLSKNIWQEYASCWVDRYTILLQSKMHPELTIICCAQKVPTQELLDLCVQAFERERDDSKKNRVKNRSMSRLNADIRFAHQIVFSHDAARGIHGAS